MDAADIIKKLTLCASKQPRTTEGELMLAAAEKIEQLLQAGDWLEGQMAFLSLRFHRMQSALAVIACPKRADGTYNNCREACETIAKEALKDGNG